MLKTGISGIGSLSRTKLIKICSAKEEDLLNR
jgi:hypothetical protein